MIASSVFVLSALTLTGIYMKSNHTQEQDDGYTIDFTALESNVDEKYQEIAQNNPVESAVDPVEDEIVSSAPEDIGNLEDDLDYLPMEVGSGLVTIPGLTDGLAESEPTEEFLAQEPEVTVPEEEDKTASQDPEAAATPDVSQGEGGETDGATEGAESTGSTNSEPAVETLHFAESEGLLRPVSGEVLIPFSMDSSVYFSTLDQFKYNPALMIAAEQGAAVAACADGRVVDIFQSEEIGNAVTVELGDGYQITYGQLDAIRVAEGNLVQPGETIAFVAAPTKYFSVEGSNLYLELTLDGTPVDPEALLR